MRRLLAALALASCAPVAPPPVAPPAPAPAPAPVVASPPAPAAAPAPSAAALPGEIRAVFHLSDPSRPASARGLQNAINGLQALGGAPARFVFVVHGQALAWFRRGEQDNLADLLARLLATGRVELRICARTLEENHWTLADMLPGATVVPSGTLEVIRLQREGFAYFKP